MKAEVEDAIKVLLAKVTKQMPADEAMKFTQSALNLAHVWATFEYKQK